MKNILFELNQLRFEKLIKYEEPQNQYYGIVKNEYKTDESYFGRSAEVNDVCCRCEPEQNNNFLLKIVSHGCYSLDLFKKQNLDESYYADFHDDGVMFIMESPAANLDACYQKNFNGKHPAKVWWWLESKNTNNPTEYPNNFSQKKYGEFFNSLIHTFKLKNAYMTNFIKCGLLDKEEKNFGQFEAYSEQCKENCFKNILLDEIIIIKPKILFALSSNVFNYLNNDVCKKEIKESLGYEPIIVKLPHPANPSLSNEYFRTLWYCRILRELIKGDIIKNSAEQQEYWAKYVNEQ